VYIRKGEVPIVRAARTYVGGKFITPSRTDTVIETNDPITTTNKIARSFNPNQSNANGNQQMLGRDWNPATSDPNVSSAHC